MRLQLGLLTSAVIAAGCATQGVSSYSYTPSASPPVTNEKLVSRPQAAVWDELVKELSKSFFVINNIERESRIINVSFNSNSPAEYVDCGRSRRTYQQGDKSETFEYAVADRSSYRIAGQRQPNPSTISYFVVNRQPSVEGRANIYVAPDSMDNRNTLVTVNVRYALTVRARGEGIVENIYGQVLNRQSIPEQTTSMLFNTNRPSTTQENGVTITCSGTGHLESEILEMAR